MNTSFITKLKAVQVFIHTHSTAISAIASSGILTILENFANTKLSIAESTAIFGFLKVLLTFLGIDSTLKVVPGTQATIIASPSSPSNN